MYITYVDKFQNSSRITSLKSKLSFEHNYWSFFVRFSFNDVYLEALPSLGKVGSKKIELIVVFLCDAQNNKKLYVN